MDGGWYDYRKMTKYEDVEKALNKKVKKNVKKYWVEQFFGSLESLPSERINQQTEVSRA